MKFNRFNAAGPCTIGPIRSTRGHQYSAASYLLRSSYQKSQARVWFLGTDWENTVIYNYTIAASYLTISVPSPYLGAMADKRDVKIFMNTFMITGGLSTMFMYSSLKQSWISISVGLFRKSWFYRLVYILQFLFADYCSEKYDRRPSRILVGIFGEWSY